MARVTARTWHGRRGPVILGPTEHRVASWLRDRTHNGRVRIATVDLAAALGLERSEAYRITARLRVLGLFGIENDQGGARGGRWIWRTAIEHDTPGLDAARHREAWARVVGWARSGHARLTARLASLHTPWDRKSAPDHAATGPATTAGAGPVTFAEQMRAAGLGRLMDQWGVT